MIELQGVSVRYQERYALHDVSLTVPAGQRVAVVGANGAGKTTLFRCLLDLVPYTGAIHIDGLDARRDGVRARSRMGYVPQVPAFPPRLTAAEVVALFQQLRGVLPDPLPVLEEVGLGPHADKMIRTLSGGMVRRLALAVASIGSPPVLLLDEPTSYLDRDGEELLLDRIASAAEASRTLLVASHHLRGLEAHVDRMILLDDGRVVADALTAELWSRHWVEIIAPPPPPPALPCGVRLLSRRNGALHLRVPDAQIWETVRALSGRPFRIHEPAPEDLLRESEP
ncbi:MAG: ABC transporter ATP-binding protein [Armatimonadota bacterium]|nr:ABC transporter ATP-binding protein [Armatimonadota bacterium]MDR5697866.1 ABC transporter ATP-binding protein [Armatimonadota bacterium]